MQAADNMFNEGTICQNEASQATNMRKYFYLNLLIEVVQKLLGLKLFSRVLFQLSGDFSKQIYCYVFLLCIIGTGEVHRETQRFDKST